MLVGQFLQERGLVQSLEAFMAESGCPSLDGLAMGGQLDDILFQQASLDALADSKDNSLAMDLLTRGNDDYPRRVSVSVDQLSPANLLSVAISPNKTQLAVSSADKSIRLLDFSGAVLDQLPFPKRGPVISLDFHPQLDHLLVSGSMDGSVIVCNLNNKDEIPLKRHGKYVVRVLFSPNGLYLATCSYDKFVHIYKMDGETANLYESIEFPENPECLTYTHDSEQLLIGVRNYCWLTHFELDTKTTTRVNLNELNDEHVSFSPLHMSLSPDGRTVLMSTDKNYLVLYQLGESKVLRRFWDIKADSDTAPRHVWHRSGRYIISSSVGKDLMVWEVASQRQVAVLRAHAGPIRDLAYVPHSNQLISVSFDKSLKIWNL